MEWIAVVAWFGWALTLIAWWQSVQTRRRLERGLRVWRRRALRAGRSVRQCWGHA